MRRVEQFRSLVIGLWPLVLAVVALNVLLTTVFGAAPSALRDAERVDTDALFATSAKLDAARRSLEAEPELRQKLVVVTGLSTAREGIDPAVFTGSTSAGVRLLNIAGSGGSFTELRAYSEPLFQSSLRPSAVIIGIHPSWLAGRSRPSAPLQWGMVLDDLAERPADGLRSTLPSWIGQHVWIVNNRAGINAYLRQLMLSVRKELGDALHLDLAELARGAVVDPWSFAPTYSDMHAPASFLALQLREWESYGWFDAARYDGATAGTTALGELLRALATLSPSRVVVLMPESTDFRARVPSNAVDRLLQVVRSEDAGAVVLDLRASLPDEYFRDHAHLNAAGREALSRRLGNELEARLAARAPAEPGR